MKVAEGNVLYKLAIHCGQVYTGSHFTGKRALPGKLFKIRLGCDRRPDPFKEDVADDPSRKRFRLRVGSPVPPLLNVLRRRPETDVDRTSNMVHDKI